jgi:hypothetical protein
MMDDGMRDPKFGMILVHRYWIERTVGIWGFVDKKKQLLRNKHENIT